MADKEYIDKHEAYLLLKQKAETYMLPATKEAYEKAAILIDSLPTIEVKPVKHGRWIDHEKLIGIFRALCDHMVDNGRCDVFCPYADTKDESDECEAWRTIQKIRREAENETD